MSNQYNPIQSVGGVEVACPSAYEWSLQDISAPDAGRTEDGKMDKMLIRQCVKLHLEWQNIDTEKASAILNAFNSEYINVRYLDLLKGEFTTKEFYVGDRTAPAYNTRLGIWSNVTFNIIER